MHSLREWHQQLGGLRRPVHIGANGISHGEPHGVADGGPDKQPNRLADGFSISFSYGEPNNFADGIANG